MPQPALLQPTPASHPVLDTATLGFLRVQGARSRCLARSDVFACSATLCNKTCTVESRAISLIRALSCDEALGGLRLYEPGASDVSFDEMWLLAALQAGAREDRDSLTFLLARRLQKPARRHIGALIMALSRALRK